MGVRAIYLSGDDQFLTLLDEEDYNYHCQYKWQLVWAPRQFYVRRKLRYTRGGRETCYSVYLHREIATKYLHPFQAVDLLGDPLKLVVDHINGNTLDNRRSNLRWLTYSENALNIPLSTKNNWGMRGKRPVILGQDHDTALLVLDHGSSSQTG